MGILVVGTPAQMVQMDSKYLSTVGDTMLEIPRVSQCDVGQTEPHLLGLDKTCLRFSGQRNVMSGRVTLKWIMKSSLLLEIRIRVYQKKKHK